MVTDILNKMAEIVANAMTHFQSDFEKYDRLYIESDEVKFPMIWIVGTSHTHLLKLGEYKNWFFKYESVRYDYVYGNNEFDYYLTNLTNDRIFLITENNVNEIDCQQAKAAIQDYVAPAVHAWVEQNGPLPQKAKVPVKINNISLATLKELITNCRKHGDDSLLSCLKRFHRYRRTASNQCVEVSYNPGYNEFTFCQITNGNIGLVGGIIFHGWPETGYQINNSVQLTPQYGWAIHT